MIEDGEKERRELREENKRLRETEARTNNSSKPRGFDTPTLGDAGGTGGSPGRTFDDIFGREDDFQTPAGDQNRGLSEEDQEAMKEFLEKRDGKEKSIRNLGGILEILTKTKKKTEAHIFSKQKGTVNSEKRDGKMDFWKKSM